MEQREESVAVETTEGSGGSLGLRLILGGALGYLAGKVLWDKPGLGLVLGIALGFVMGPSGDEEA